MTWCDKMASTPAVGLQFESALLSESQIFAALAPIMNRFVRSEKMDFSVDERAPWALAFTTNDGFKFSVDQHKIAVTFQHRVQFKSVSGGPPTMEMLSQPRPFSELIEQCHSRLIEMNELLKSVRRKNILRVGIVSNTVASLDDMPPGISEFYSYLSKPWGGNISECNTRLVNKITANDKAVDRCIHQLIVPEKTDELSTLILDWQRTWARPQPPDERSLRRMLTEATSESLAYFDLLAEGAMFNADS